MAEHHQPPLKRVLDPQTSKSKKTTAEHHQPPLKRVLDPQTLKNQKTMAKHHRFLLFYGERSANNYYLQATTATLTASAERSTTLTNDYRHPHGCQ